MENETKPKAARKPAAAKPTAAVGDLVRLTLLKAAEANGGVKLTGKDGALFATAGAANKDAIAECMNPEKPLLTVVRKEGKAEIVALAPAGFERIARELPEEKVGSVAKGVATGLPAGTRAEFIQATISRTPLAAAELTPLLEEAIAAEKAEHETRIAAAAKRKATEEAAKKAMIRALELFDERRKNRLDAIKREWEAEGENAAELPPIIERKKTGGGTTPEPKTPEDLDFRRYEADRLAAAWRDAWDAKKDEGRDYLESAMWNIRGLRMVGEVGTNAEFDGRYHESESPVFTDDPVQIVRPGWLLKEDEGDYVALKAAVEKA